MHEINGRVDGRDVRCTTTGYLLRPKSSSKSTTYIFRWKLIVGLSSVRIGTRTKISIGTRGLLLLFLDLGAHSDGQLIFN